MLIIEDKICKLIHSCIREFSPHIPEEKVPQVYLEIPKLEKFGEFSTNVAMRLASILSKPSKEVSEAFFEILKERLEKSELKTLIKKMDLVPPGFINLYLTEQAFYMMLKDIIKGGLRFGQTRPRESKKVLIEFVSANPTGPLTVAHARQAAIGDSLGNILKFCGHRVTKEYYINDEGIQMALLGRSVRARYFELLGKADGACFPESGYKGEYIYQIAKEVKKRYRNKFLEKSESESLDFFIQFAYRSIMKGIKKDLKDFAVEFDTWFSQKALRSSGKIESSLEFLKRKDFLYEKDGAVWFKATIFEDEKDRVVIKKDGNFTYIAPDIAYHRDKFERGFDDVINIWGPDHHGYIPRIKAAVEALGYPKERLSILLVQLATLSREGRPIRMSTRQGEFITMREVMDEVGRDAARFFFLMRKQNSHLDFDLELAKKESPENPVYYIQYAHARVASVLRFSNIKLRASLKIKFSLLDKKEELELIKRLAQFPKVIFQSAESLEPYYIVSYLLELAKLFHFFYNTYRIVSDDKGLTCARLALVSAAKNVLANGLRLLGVSAPEKM